MEKLCELCQNQDHCIHCKNKDLKGRIFNLIIFESKEKTLFYNIPNKAIYLKRKNKNTIEISFREAIREIDIIPSKAPQWKRLQILNLAKDLGFFGINA